MAITINGNGTVTGITSGAGKILQVVQTAKTDVFTTTSSTFTNVTGLTVNITPSSTSSKVLVIGSVLVTSNSNDMYKTRIARDGTGIFVGDAVSGTTSGLIQYYSYNAYQLQDYSTLPSPVMYLDSPSSTSQLTYSWQIRSQSGGTTVVNRHGNNSGNSSQAFRGASSIIVMEVAG